MHNYFDFEADYPKKREVYKFLLCDYFHDSKFCGFNYDSINSKLKLRIQCNREWEKSKKKSIDDEEFGYILFFYGVTKLTYNNDLRSDCFLNGRFKKTEQLVKEQKKTKRMLYQFRMQFLGGYMDIIFRSFKIKKVNGRVNYRDIDNYESSCIKYLKKSNDELDVLRKELYSQKEQLIDDLRLEYFYANKVEDLPCLCRYVIKNNNDIDIKAYATWLLGKCGDKEDITLIKNVYEQIVLDTSCGLYENNTMIQLNFIDTIERLRDKMK